jgi:hypothetical protein
MAVLKATRAAQTPKVASFTFNVTDTMVNTSAASTAFGAASGTVFDVINLPVGARVIGGDMVVEVVSNDASTATIAVGDSASASRYLSATTIKTAARTALVPTGYHGLGENLRITLANAGGAATTGTVTVNVTFVIDNRADEVYPN